MKQKPRAYFLSTIYAPAAPPAAATPPTANQKQLFKDKVNELTSNNDTNFFLIPEYLKDHFRLV